MNKKIRKQVFDKYDSYCAYCGKKITMENFQVDHITSKHQWGTDDLDNLNPACRSCNHYKRAASLEEFRELMKTIHERLQKIYIVRVAIDFGIIKIEPFDGEFYFEREARWVKLLMKDGK